MPSRKINQRLLEDMREGLARSVEYFSSRKKAERERWTCQEFVRNLNVRPWSKSFISPAVDPPDVVYRAARFEVKEILDKGRRRHQEYRDSLAKALLATDPSEMLKQYSPKDITPQDVGNLVAAELTRLRRKYDPKLQQTLDLLFYVNLIGTSLGKGPMPQFDGSGWRSVSVLFGWHSLVFHAERGAPKLIRGAAGRAILRIGKNG